MKEKSSTKTHLYVIDIYEAFKQKFIYTVSSRLQRISNDSMQIIIDSDDAVDQTLIRVSYDK